MHTLAKRPNIISLVLIKHDTSGKRTNITAYEHPRLFLRANLITNVLKLVRLPYFHRKLVKIATYKRHSSEEQYILAYGAGHGILAMIANKSEYICYQSFGGDKTYHFLNGKLHREDGYAVESAEPEESAYWYLGRYYTSMDDMINRSRHDDKHMMASVKILNARLREIEKHRSEASHGIEINSNL